MKYLALELLGSNQSQWKFIEQRLFASTKVICVSSLGYGSYQLAHDGSMIRVAAKRVQLNCVLALRMSSTQGGVIAVGAA